MVRQGEQAWTPRSTRVSFYRWYVCSIFTGCGLSLNLNIGDPPFFLGEQKSFYPNNFVSSGSDEEFFGVEQKDDSENHDLRGVIDDLTIENKRLKMLLKSARSRPASETTEAHDRLFDLRIHGLSVGKKRELENLLRTFASSVHTSNAASTSSTTHGSGQPQTTSEGSSEGMPNQRHLKPGHLPTDSGYGTNSISGGTSANASHGQLPGTVDTERNPSKNIRSYLHDIPDTLLPRQSLYMSKRAKMALVVRRLENLFTGRNAAPGDHSQPLQQQEVSHSAAHADNPQHRSGGREGKREAHMLPQDTKVNLDAFDRQQASPPTKKPKLRHELTDLSESMTSRPGSPWEQRPTRPLDLDIHRAQVADDNIQYLRHLGMSSPQIRGTGDQAKSQWIYLNLLISMAQLHAINVTPSFIRQAIRKLSTKFELSEDGHRVRWTGGTEGTVFSKEEERAMEMTDPGPAESNDDSGRTSSKRSKTDSSSNVVTSEQPSSEDKISRLYSSDQSKQKVSTAATSQVPVPVLGKGKTPGTPGTPFDYKPIVYRGKRYSPAASYLDSSVSSGSPDSSGLANALSRSNLNRRHGSEDGMITFYQNPFFCTDLSADKSPVNWIPQRKAMPWDTLGIPAEYIDESPLRHHDACYFTPQFAPRLSSDAEYEPVLAFNVEPLRFCGEYETVPYDLPVSGIGGVVPDDNFALDVKVLRNTLQPGKGKKLAPVPVTNTRKRTRYEFEVDECEKLDLQPSKLPPPSYVFFASSSSSHSQGDGYSSDDSDESSSEVAEINPPPPTFLNPWSTRSDEEDDDDNSSVDMLDAARAADPDRIAAQEREFLINQNVGNRIEGSLAATVGASRSVSSRGNHDTELQDDDTGAASDMEVDEDSDSSSDDEDE